MTDDRAALRAACEAGVGLCTISNIEGSFSRRLGAQLAVHSDGPKATTLTGSLADGCLEQQLAAEIAKGGEQRVMRFGAGSPMVDFRLPCGSGLDILVDPAPDHAACRAVIDQLDRREAASLALPVISPLAQRDYVPALRLLVFGEGPELDTLEALGIAAGVEVESFSKDGTDLSLGHAPQDVKVDRWCAIVLLFHDHEWEQAILRWALATPAFFIGAQGGLNARQERSQRLIDSGVAADDLTRIASPIGIVQHSREPAALALSILASVVGEYEAIHPHHARKNG